MPILRHPLSSKRGKGRPNDAHIDAARLFASLAPYLHGEGAPDTASLRDPVLGPHPQSTLDELHALLQDAHWAGCTYDRTTLTLTAHRYAPQTERPGLKAAAV